MEQRTPLFKSASVNTGAATTVKYLLQNYEKLCQKYGPNNRLQKIQDAISDIEQSYQQSIELLNLNDPATKQNFLHIAVKNSCHHNITEYLLSKLNKGASSSFDRWGKLPIHYVFAQQKNFNINDCNNLITLVNHATFKKSELSFYSVKNDDNISLNDDMGSNLLRLAVKTESVLAVDTVLQRETLKPLLYKKDNSRLSHPIFYAIERGNLQIVKSLINADEKKLLHKERNENNISIFEFANQLAQKYSADENRANIYKELRLAYLDELFGGERQEISFPEGIQEAECPSKEPSNNKRKANAAPGAERKKEKKRKVHDVEPTLTKKQEQHFFNILYHNMLQFCKNKWPDATFPKVLRAGNFTHPKTEMAFHQLSNVLVIPGEEFKSNEEANLFKDYLERKYAIYHKESQSIWISKNNDIKNVCKKRPLQGQKSKIVNVYWVSPDVEYSDNTLVITDRILSNIYDKLKGSIEIGSDSFTNNTSFNVNSTMLVPHYDDMSNVNNVTAMNQYDGENSNDVVQKFTFFVEEVIKKTQERKDALREEEDALKKKEELLNKEREILETACEKKKADNEQLKKCISSLEKLFDSTEENARIKHVLSKSK